MNDFPTQSPNGHAVLPHCAAQQSLVEKASQELLLLLGEKDIARSVNPNNKL
jgi:hypothetical protein